MCVHIVAEFKPQNRIFGTVHLLYGNAYGYYISAGSHARYAVGTVSPYRYTTL